ncbi:hypothetical protein GYMLUDRAFT_42391 [Collybiopsis luxurians FD-317 M1]|uniref:Uncharacterized protein n=1 Tax=Collybiopsis luxurians FD-317 M1 TaxID=944289 RepID=A0A0D0C1H9_9AGAR|nr:hypothetical protein GYMLUDRAFT_42391 [Collybiopsis luxurians FD-317 M1]
MLRTLSRTNSGKPKRKCLSPVLFVVAVRPDNQNDVTERPNPRIPIELVENIIDFMIQSHRSDSKAAFAAVSSFSLASKAFRQVAFRNFLRLICINDDSTSWDGIHSMISEHQARNGDAEGFSLIKAFDTSSTAITKDARRLKSLLKLQGLRLAFEREGLSTQHSICNLLFSNIASSNLSVLVIDMLPRIDRTLLSLVSATFPSLTILLLSVTGRLPCEGPVYGNHFLDALECCLHSPIPHSHGDLILLVEAFGEALQPLVQLRELQLGVFLSDEHTIYTHIRHSNRVKDAGYLITTSPSDCSVCRDALQIRAREERASRMIFSKLENLRRISWSTLFLDVPMETLGDGLSHSVVPRQEGDNAFQMGTIQFELAG